MKRVCLRFLSVGIGCTLIACSALAQSPSAAQAEKYPSKPIRVVVPSSAGGGNDILVRLLGAKMSEHWGQQIVSDLRPGAGGIIGSEIVARAPPDGHTILIVAGGYALNTLLYAKLPYDTFKDFERVTIVAFAPNVLVVHPSLPVHSLQELISLAKAKPGALSYASSGIGTTSYLSAELLMRMAGIKMVHIPYKGAGASSTAVLVGEVPIILSAPSTNVPFVRAKRLRALGVTSPERMSIIPDVPAISEILPGYEVQNFFGILVPAKTPRPIIDKLHAELVRVLNLPDIRDRLLTLGFVPGGNSPEEFTAYVQAEIVKWSKAFKEMGIKPE